MMELPQARPVLARGLTTAQLVALDCLVAAGYVTALLVLWHTQARSGEPAGDLAGPAADALAVATGLPLAVRRVWPRPVFGVVLAVSAVSVPLGAVRDPFLAAAFALYPVALARPARPWPPAVAVGVLGAAGLVVPEPDVPYSLWWVEGPGLILMGWATIGGSWVLGSAVRERRAHAPRAATWLAEQAVADERLRIARELHDIVAHSVGLIAVKAAIANHVVATRPEEAGEALRVIEATSRGALREMRQLLGLLRTGRPSGSGDAGLGPAPGLADLGDLARNATAAGLRHRRSAGFAIRSDGREVNVEVTDSGRRGSDGRDGPPEADGGQGLIGMRERVAVYGGAFASGPRPGGGFGVAARIPFTPARDGREVSG